MKVFKLLGSASLIGLVASYGAHAQDFVGSSGNNQNLIMRMNYDRTGGEGVIIQEGRDFDNNVRTFATILNNSASFSGNILDIADDTVNIGENLDVNGTVRIQGAATVTSGGLNVTGATDLNSGLNVDGQSTLDDTTIVGTTSVTGQTTVAGTTSINTTGTAATTIGNVNSLTTVSMAGGSSNVSIANGQTNINTSGGSANTNIGVAGNTTSVLSTTVGIGNAASATTVSIGTGSAANTVSLGNVVVGTQVAASAGNATMDMRNGSITNSVTSSTTSVMMDGSIANTVDGEGMSGGTVIAANGSARLTADTNGKITAVTSSDTTSGTTAAMFVTNPQGNTHGLVVQETKTTLSGGINSASMTLDDRGATFSDPADGAPIQVHGVADGTAPFDAVNVRQLYSGLASVLASTPDIELAPGRTGMAIGLGGYGGYSAIGIGFGHMYDNGTTLRASASKGEYSEVAYRASVSWNW